MKLFVEAGSAETLRAGYQCPCGCTPSVEYARGATAATDSCCCGNQFAVGPHAATALTPAPDFRPERRLFETPWGDQLEAAWMVGPSVHGPQAEQHADNHDHGPEHSGVQAGLTAMDPVCGMSVEPEQAAMRGLRSEHEGVEYFFCGKGCKLEFDDDPQRYLDSAYQPAM